VKYFISPPEPPENWRIDPEQFRAQLRARWPEIQISDASEPEDDHVMEWQLQMSQGPVEGALTRDGEAVILEGDLRDCATLAAWFRTTVPGGQALLFYDEGFGVDAALPPGIGADEIARPFLSAGDET
jgi:hypothetical protein